MYGSAGSHLAINFISHTNTLAWSMIVIFIFHLKINMQRFVLYLPPFFATLWRTNQIIVKLDGKAQDEKGLLPFHHQNSTRMCTLHSHRYVRGIWRWTSPVWKLSARYSSPSHKYKAAMLFLKVSPCSPMAEAEGRKLQYLQNITSFWIFFSLIM